MPVVMALFDNPTDAERAVSELSLNGFTEKDVSVVLFKAFPTPWARKHGLLGWLMRGGLLGDTIDRADGKSFMDGTGVGAVVGALLGMVYGSLWRYGPIAASTGGLLAGGLLGYLVDRLIPEKRREQMDHPRARGSILVRVRCPTTTKGNAVRRLLKSNQARELVVLPEREPIHIEEKG